MIMHTYLINLEYFQYLIFHHLSLIYHLNALPPIVIFQFSMI